MFRNATDEEFNRDELLWRYFKTDRFVDLLSSGELYFASARQFQDPFEGATAVLQPGTVIDSRYPLNEEPGERAFEALRRMMKVCCWHRASYESDAMWQLYAGEWKGVAICTTPGRIEAAASTFRLQPQHQGEDLWAGSVKYVDLLANRLRISMLERFWHKHMAFSWEREFRIGISLRLAEEFGVQIPDDGIRVPFNLDQLVEKVVLGPSLGQEEVARVRAAADRVGLGQRIAVSSMLGIPRYT